LSKGENIVKWIKGQRMSRLGHLEKMEENRMPKAATPVVQLLMMGMRMPETC
jgi:hypothetical protein